MYQQTFAIPFNSLNAQPSVCCIHLPDIIPIGDSLKFPPPLPFRPSVPRHLPLNTKRGEGGWLGTGAVVSQRTTISHLSTASKATSESALLRLPPAATSSVRWNQPVTWWLINWAHPDLPSIVSHPRWIWSHLRSVVTLSCERRAFTCNLPYFLVLNEVWLRLVYFFNCVLVWGTVGFCFLAFSTNVMWPS